MKILYLTILIINGNAMKMQRCIAKQIQVTVRREMQINPMLMQRAYFGETFKQKFNYTKMKTWLEEVDVDRVIRITSGLIIGFLISRYNTMCQNYEIMKQIIKQSEMIEQKDEKIINQSEMIEQKDEKIINQYEEQNKIMEKIINQYKERVKLLEKLMIR